MGVVQLHPRPPEPVAISQETALAALSAIRTCLGYDLRFDLAKAEKELALALKGDP